MELSSGKTIVRNTMFLYFRMILIMLISFYTVRLILKILGVEDYGIYNAVGGVVTSMSFLTNVLSNASQRFFSVELTKGKDGINTVFSSILAVYIAICVLIIIVLEVGGVWLIANKLTIPDDRFGIANFVFHISLATFIINVISTPFRALIIANERMDVYAYVSLFEAVGKLVIVFGLYHTTIDKLLAYALLLMLITLATNLLYIMFVFRKLHAKIRLVFEKGIVKSVMAYSSWTLFGTVAGVANIQGNCILFNIFVGPIANAAFAIANQVNSAVRQFTSNFYTAVSPPLIKSYSSGNTEYMNSLFWFSSKAIFFLSFVILMPLFTQTEYVLRLWLGEVSPYMVNFVRIMLIYTFVISMGSPITTIVQASGKVKQYHTIVDGFGLLVLPLSYVVLKLGYSPEMALISMVCVFCIAHLLRLIILSKTITFSILQYFRTIVLPCVLVIALCGIVVYFTGLFGDGDSKILPLLYMFLVIILSGSFSLLLLFRSEERKRIFSFVIKRNQK